MASLPIGKKVWMPYLLNAHRMGFVSDEPSLREFFCNGAERMFLNIKATRFGKAKALWACINYEYFEKNFSEFQDKQYQTYRVPHLFLQMTPLELARTKADEFPERFSEIERKVCAQIEEQLVLIHQENTLKNFYVIYHMRWFFEMFASVLPTIMLITGLLLFAGFATFVLWHSLETGWLEFFSNWWGYLKIIFSRGE